MKRKIALVVVGLPLDKHFDYLIPEKLHNRIVIGVRVRIPFHGRKIVGYVVGFNDDSEFESVKSILEVLDGTPIVDDIYLALAKRISESYGCSLGEAIEFCLPKYICRGKPSVKYARSIVEREVRHCIYYGIGSLDKKWKELHLVLKDNATKGYGTIILVPENRDIDNVCESLDGDLQRFIIKCDKRLTMAAEESLHQRLQKAGCKIVVGTRSSVFNNVCDLRTIVVFDEANGAYKEESSPYSHIRDLVLMRSDVEYIDTFWITSLPSIELWYQACQSSWKKVLLRGEIGENFKVMDMMNYNPEKANSLSAPVYNIIDQGLKDNKTIVLIVNQRDFFPFRDREGGEVKRSKVDRLDYVLKKYNQQLRIGFYNGQHKSNPKTQVIIATPTVIKEKWFNADIAIVTNFDTLINALDFRSSHKSFQWVYELRLCAKSVVLQTYIYDHYLVKGLKTENFDEFYQEEMKQRQELGFPPFGHIVSYSLRSNGEDKIKDYMNRLSASLRQREEQDIEIMDPVFNEVTKWKEKFNGTMLLKSKFVKRALDVLKEEIKTVRKGGRFISTIEVE